MYYRPVAPTLEEVSELQVKGYRLALHSDFGTDLPTLVAWLPENDKPASVFKALTWCNYAGTGWRFTADYHSRYEKRKMWAFDLTSYSVLVDLAQRQYDAEQALKRAIAELPRLSVTKE